MECSVCLEYLFSEETGVLKCGHCFHIDCLKKIENELPSDTVYHTRNYDFYKCPVCRFRIDIWDGGITKLMGVVDHRDKIKKFEFLVSDIEMMESEDKHDISFQIRVLETRLNDLNYQLDNKKLTLDRIKDDKIELIKSIKEIIDNFQKERDKLIITSREELDKISNDRKKELSNTRDELIKLSEEFENKITNKKKLLEKEEKRIDDKKEKLESEINKKALEKTKEYLLKLSEENKKRKKVEEKLEEMKQNLKILVSN